MSTNTNEVRNGNSVHDDDSARRRKAMDLLISSLGEEPRRLIQGIDDPKEAFEKIRKAYSFGPAGELYMFIRAFDDLKLNDSGLLVFLDELERLRLKIASLGDDKKSDLVMICRILTGLTPEYKPFEEAFESGPKEGDSWVLANFKERLSKFDRDLQHDSSKVSAGNVEGYLHSGENKVNPAGTDDGEKREGN